jgi:hypothetical protein
MGTNAPRRFTGERGHDELDELKRRLAAFVHRIDLAGEIAARPWEAVGLAALAGAAWGFARPRAAIECMDLRDKLLDAALSVLGALALRAIRDVAVRQVTDAAKRWWDETSPRGNEVPNAPVH